MKKSYYLLLALIIIGISSSQQINAQENFYTKQEIEHRHNEKPKKHRYDLHFGKIKMKFHNSDLKQERLSDIDYRLDVLEARYKYDKNKLKNSPLTKDEKKMREKELKYMYNRDKEYLKTEKKIIKNNSH